MMGKPTDKPISPFGSEDRIQSLRVWDPPDFCLAFFWYVLIADAMIPVAD
jgi:hypothetical protein